MKFDTVNTVLDRSFFRIKEVLDLPNLIEIQTDSFQDLLDHGLKEVFEDLTSLFQTYRHHGTICRL